MKMKQFLKPLAIAVVSGSLLTGCIGQFALTDKLYDWNKQVGNKWVAEGVFLVLNIIPVYGVTVFVDAVVLNSVEFWTRTNPVSGKRAVVSTETMQTPDGTSVTMTYHGDGAIDVDYQTVQGEKGEFTLKKGENTVALFSQDGQLMATADAQGKLVL